MKPHSGTGVSIPASNYLPPLPTKRRSSRSNSLSSSSASVITVQRSSSPGGHSRQPVVQIQSHSPADSTLLAVRALKGGSKGRRTSVPHDRVEGDSTIYTEGTTNLNRWSRSTASDITSVGDGHQFRSNSGAGPTMSPDLWAQRRPSASPSASPRRRPTSPRTSPSRQPSSASDVRTDKYRHRVPSANSLRAGSSNTSAPNHIPLPSMLSPLESRSPSSRRPLTPGSTGLLTPASYNTPSDYFGIAVSKDNSPRLDDASPVSTIASRYSSARTPLEPSDATRRDKSKEKDMTEEERGEASKRRSRIRERRERDKKSMLSKALEKANTAVLLDNAQNFEGALDAYQDACKLLQHVMDKTSGQDDKRKLEAIRETYSVRIDELQQLQQPVMIETGKHLPPRPMSNDSADFVQQVDMTSQIPMLQESRDSAPELPPKPIRAPSASGRSRDSFLTTAIREVEGTRSDGFLGPLWERSKSPLGRPLLEEDAERKREMDSSYVPRPLSPSPRRALSPAAPPPEHPREEQQAEAGAEELPTDAEQHLAPEAGSWLDTIDESGSSRASSVHAASPKHGIRRKDLRAAGHDDHSDFDAAFDAAVEAAYEEGYEPDQNFQKYAEPHSQNTMAFAAPSRPRTETQSTIEAESEFDHEAEEQRMLDDIARDYLSNGFDFNLQTKSALPRESDSSGYSRSTWQSSAVSDRLTAGTSLSTLPETRLSHMGAALTALPALPGPPIQTAAPPPLQLNTSARPNSAHGSQNSQILERRGHRLSGPVLKPLRIDTSPRPMQRTEENSGTHPVNQAQTDSPTRELRDMRPGTAGTQSSKRISTVPSLRKVESELSTPFPASAVSDSTNSMSLTSSHPPSSVDPTNDLYSPKPKLLRKNKSSLSLRDHGIPATPVDGDWAQTPFTSTFNTTQGRRGESSFGSQRTRTTSLSGAQSGSDAAQVGGLHLFDTSLSPIDLSASPKEANASLPSNLEPCPDSYLLRPFWLLRSVASTITHPRGGFITTRLFMPHEAWLNRSVKLKNVEDKIAACDLLTAALGRLARADTYDADAVLDELQGFEEVMDRVQATLVKRLGGDVGIQSVGALFKDAASTDPSNSSVSPEFAKDGGQSKTNSGKSYLTSWRKLRGKNSVTGAGVVVPGAGPGKEGPGFVMASVPMTSFAGVEKRTNRNSVIKRDGRDFHLEGPLKEYMASIAKLSDAAGALDQIARQVEDPGLKHSSTTHVGLELSTRHAAEFFGFYICRFLLADVGVLIDKFVKRGTEWVTS